MKYLLTSLATILISTFSYSQLIISQYVETNSGTTPKGIELFNNSGATIDFSTSNLVVLKGANGGAPSADFTLTSGSMADGEVIVIGTSDIGTYLTNNGLGSVQFFTEGFTFNGDDALVIELGGVIQDVFGLPNTDPGSAWSGGGVSTANQNIQVLCSAVSSGDTDGWTDPSERFENVGLGTDLTGFGVAPDCGPGGTTSVQFASVSYSTDEAGPDVTVCVSITDEDATNATTVEVSLDVSSSATNGSDYTTISYPVTLTFPAGDASDQCITIDVLEDLDTEGDETVILNLQNVAGGNSASLGVPAQTIVTITDNETTATCTEPVWEVISTETNSSGSNGGEWTAITGGFSANGFCGGGCAEPVDSWLLYGPLDLTSTAYTDLQFDAQENFGNTDLVVAYSTDFSASSCPSNATWNILATITELDEGAQSISFGAAMGSSDVYIGIQYNDDGADGYSVWDLTGFSLIADVCPGVGVFPGNGCITCTATVVETGATCDNNTSGIDMYTATFDYDATSETKNLTVTASAGSPSPTLVGLGTSGSITVSGIPEGTDCQITLTSTNCSISATQESPFCTEPQSPTCAAGGTSLVYDAFEGSTSGVASPEAYSFPGDLWGPIDSLGPIAALSGDRFWGAVDIDNGSFSGPHTITYDASFTAGTYTALNVSFYYYSDGYDSSDKVYYKYTNGTQPEDSVALEKSTGAWTEVVLNLPLDPGATSFQLVLGAQQNGTDYLGFDEVNICGSIVPACTASITGQSATCDDVTSGTDTYTASFAYDASGETEDLTVSSDAGTADASSVTAGSSGTITVSNIPEGTDVTVTLTNVSCSIDASLSSPNCVPLPNVIITEIMKDPFAVDDSFGEYFEVYNLEDSIVDINGWVLSDDGSNTHTIDNGGPLTIGSGQFLVLGNNADGLTNGGVPVDYQYSSFTLSNGDDEVILSLEGNEVDRVAYDDLNFPDSTGAALNLDPGSFDAIANDDGANWCVSTSVYGDGDQGTPGIANDACGLDCSVFETAPVDLTKSFDPVNGVQDRVQVKWFKDTPQVRYSDEDAAACDIKFWPKRNLNPDGTVTGPVIVAAPEDTVVIQNAKKFQPDGITPREIFKWPVKFRADGANNNKRAEPNIRYEWQVRCACDHGAGPESPWSVVKIFNTPDFDPSTGIYTPPGDAFGHGGELKSMRNRLKIYPNPSNGAQIMISMNDMEETSENILIQVVEFTGKVVHSEQFAGKKVSTDLMIDFQSRLANGLYYVNFYVNDKVITEKLVVK